MYTHKTHQISSRHANLESKQSLCLKVGSFRETFCNFKYHLSYFLDLSGSKGHQPILGLCFSVNCFLMCQTPASLSPPTSGDNTLLSSGSQSRRSSSETRQINKYFLNHCFIKNNFPPPDSQDLSLPFSVLLSIFFGENFLPKSIFGKVSSYFFLFFLPVAKYGTTQVNANLIIFK